MVQSNTKANAILLSDLVTIVVNAGHRTCFVFDVVNRLIHKDSTAIDATFYTDRTDFC